MRCPRSSIEILRSVHYLWREPEVREQYSAAISLHSHTMHSRENFGFVPRILACAAAGQALLERLEAWHQRLYAKPIPFGRAFWRPPLNPQAAYHLETSQIQSLLGLRSLVSLTDHDSIEACAELRAIGIEVPYSSEWSVPYHGTMFHIGVHNLPAEEARAFEAAMAEATAAPTRERIAELLAAFDAAKDVLLVLNHPFSCEARVPQPTHDRLLAQFLDEFGGWIHALELNGLQPAPANAAAIRLAAERAIPVISGGDRHCCEPNANLNLSNARSFAEFVNEIRSDQRSTVLFLPQYRDPIPVRYIELIWHAVRNYADFTGRARWVDRVFLERETGEIVSFETLCPNGGPAVIRGFVSTIGFLASPGMRAMLSMAMGREARLEPERP
jgi:hypothetical protein